MKPAHETVLGQVIYRVITSKKRPSLILRQSGYAPGIDPRGDAVETRQQETRMRAQARVASARPPS